jgi:Rgg/GadR/MutR family transcriptional activator
MKKKRVSNINKEYGKVFAQIRKGKGYSQHETEDSQVSAASISRFERGETMLATDSFFRTLGNIGVTVAEFEKIFYSSSSDLYPPQNLWLIAKAGEEHNLSMMESFLTQVKRKVKLKPHSKRYMLDKVLVETVIFNMDSSRKVPARDVKFLTDFLNNTKQWGRYETLIFSWTTSIFDIKTLEKLFMQMLDDSSQNLLPFDDAKLVIDTGLNVLDTLLTKGELIAAKNAIVQLEHREIHLHLLFEKLELRYNKARYNYLSGIDVDLAVKEMWYYYDVLKYAECFELANIVTKEIESLLQVEVETGSEEN